MDGQSHLYHWTCRRHWCNTQLRMKTIGILFFLGVLTFASADFRKAALKCHNKLRQKHGSPPMKLTQAMNSKAQAWADKLAQQDKMFHSQRTPGGPGENLYWSSMAGKPEDDVTAACNAWYDEIKDYNFNNGGFTSGTGHFTQLVWKESTELGVGIATSSSGGVYVVANYNPGGNIMNPGYFDKNVQRPQ